MKICVIGLGYIGLPTVAILAHNKIKVHGVDINKEVVETINKGKIHIVEPDLDEMVQLGVEENFIKASLNPIPSDVYLIVVPTPFKGNNEPDVSYVEAATRDISSLLKQGDTYIIESTSPVGTTKRMAKLIESLRPDLINSDKSLKINIAYCPERVLPGNVIHELVHNDRVIGGINEDSTEAACAFYKLFVKGKLHRTNAQTAEMCKLTENASRDAQIAFANELSLICDKADIDVWELISLANKHPRVNILQPGCGVGGHCIAVDPWFIVSDFPLESRMIGTARAINNHKSFWCAEKVTSTIKQWKLDNESAPKVALMGLAFKPNIDDLRESPAKYITTKVLQNDNDSEFMIVEPNIKEHNVFKLTDYKEAISTADIIVYLVAHKEFTKNQFTKNQIIIDFCGPNV